MFSVHCAPEEFEKAIITGYFGLCLRKIRTREDHDYRNSIAFGKLRFQNVFSPATLKRKADVFKFLRLEERFQKAPFL